MKYRAAKEYSEAALQAASRTGGISAADRAYQARINPCRFPRQSKRLCCSKWLQYIAFSVHITGTVPIALGIRVHTRWL